MEATEIKCEVTETEVQPPPKTEDTFSNSLMQTVVANGQVVDTIKAEGPVDEADDETESVFNSSDSSSGSMKNYGSDLDSDFEDDEGTPAGFGRDIPGDDDLEEPVSDAVQKAENAVDDSVYSLLGDPGSFVWQENFDTFKGTREDFTGPTPGPVKDYETPYEAFTDIWDTDFLGLIVRETNRYAEQTIVEQTAKGLLKPNSRLHNWENTDEDEIYVLFAIYILMGIDVRTSLQEYWKARGVLEMPKFRTLLSYNRYLLLSKFVHFVDNTALPSGTRHKLWKLQPVVDHLNMKFETLYNLLPEVAIDESLTHFKGILSWIQAIKTKAARSGIKTLECCESKTGYLWRFRIYTGKADSPSESVGTDLGSKSTQTVLELLKGLEHRGHLVTMDNFYNNPALARHLKSLGFDCLGTLRPHRKNVPSDISKIPKNVAKGTLIARHCGDVSIIAWKDSRLVNIISTYHDARTHVGTRSGEEFVKPLSVKDYNTIIGGIDVKDQKISPYLIARKRGIKWYIKMFKRLLNVSIHNAWVMLKASLERRRKGSISHRDFRQQLADSLIAKHKQKPASIRPGVTAGDGPAPKRLKREILHEPMYPKTRKRCIVCLRHGKEQKVHSRCVTCDEYMCFGSCWREWHSLKVLQGHEVRTRKRSKAKEIGR